ncbi:hypothetical protein [Pseudomonas typographi]|uniref:hypothetical protein n=1 Tax=Pseudomonas typographi TaxID=2715964 RepID=UPI001689A191|nr:hypothetical protein [Pseudomonas typographi]MBD1586398.1 hypothetical protein [Pseudomonas typographi]
MLRVLAISAPHWQFRPVGHEQHLNSSTPFSLQNAIRVCAHDARQGIGVWGRSNWNSAGGLANAVFMSDYLHETFAWLDPALASVRPNLVLIGAMSISFPGAVQVATRIKQALGSKVIVVIGGKHVIETTYLSAGELQLHPGSPIAAMDRGDIGPIFDLVVSGDGEELIREIGVAVAGLTGTELNASNIATYLAENLCIRGDWTTAWLDGGAVRHVTSPKLPLDYDNLPVPAALFQVTSTFPVFRTDLTAHAYSDTSKGCIYSCGFCSEAQAINGKLQGMATAHQRLFRQLHTIANLAQTQASEATISAFVEDSILLQGNAASLARLSDLIETQGLGIVFGGQLTVDMVNDPNRQVQIARLADNGLRYLFMGLETPDEDLAAAMHKNRGASRGSHKSDLLCSDATDNGWVHRSERALRFLAGAGIDCGLSLLFGLGESQTQRVALLELIGAWQRDVGQPKCISMNWAVQHPLRQPQGNKNHYLAWAIDEQDLRAPVISRIFGEASTRYCMPGVSMASLAELQVLDGLYQKLNSIV